MCTLEYRCPQSSKASAPRSGITGNSELLDFGAGKRLGPLWEQYELLTSGW